MNDIKVINNNSQKIISNILITFLTNRQFNTVSIEAAEARPKKRGQRKENVGGSDTLRNGFDPNHKRKF